MPAEDAITVIIPCFNDGEYLRRSIPSVASQMGDDDELVVVDDGSSDATEEIVGGLKASFKEKRISYHHQQNSGVSKARNHGIDCSTNGLLIFLDADDELLPGALESYRSCLNEEADLYIAGHRWIRDGVVTERIPQLSSNPEKNFDDILCKRLHIGNLSGMCFKRTVFEEYHFDPRLSVGEDLAVILLTIATKVCKNNPHVVSVVHRRASSLRDSVSGSLPLDSMFVQALFEHPALPAEYKKYAAAAQNRYYTTLLRLHWKQNNTDEYVKVFRSLLSKDRKALFSKWALRRLVIPFRSGSKR